MRKVFLILFSISLILPVILVIIFSLFTGYKYPDLFPNFFSLKFWGDVFLRNSLFAQSIVYSLIVGSLTGVFSTIIGFMTGRGVLRFKHKKLFRLFFSLPLFIPATALFIGIYSIMLKFNIINNIPAVVIAHSVICIPYSVHIFMSFLMGINPNLERQAKMLGASSFSISKKVLIPLLKPAILLSFSISFLISLSEYLSTFLMGGGKVIMISMVMYPYMQNADIQHGSVLAVVFMVINISIFGIAEILTRQKSKVKSYLFE
jgi:putative spermidine/putrescine transport system permease protein